MVNFFSDRLYRDADNIPLSSSHNTHATHASHTSHTSHSAPSLHATATITSDDVLLYCLKDLHQALASSLPGTHSNTLSTNATNATDTTNTTTPILPMNDTNTTNTYNNNNNTITTNTTINNNNNNINGGADVELENDLIMQLRHQLLSSSVSPPIESLLVDYSPRLKYIG